MRGSKKNRGAALLETVIALGILAIGTAAIVSLVTEVHRAGTKSTFQTAALDLFAGFSAQVRAASCDLDPLSAGGGVNGATTDQGLLPGGPYTAPAATFTGITLVGDFDNTNGRQLVGAPPMRLTYVVTAVPTPQGPPILEIDVTVREITRNAAKDALAMGSWIRNFRLTKVCTLRTDNDNACGNPPCGRGEYY
jgi:type II secretory pathway pseudopilin PulG